jgi:hypothetical protein
VAPVFPEAVFCCPSAVVCRLLLPVGYRLPSAFRRLLSSDVV